MCLYHLPKIILALLVAVVLASGSIAPTQAFASPGQHASATVTEGTKVTLSETSIAGPGFTGTEIAWAGTDAAHHLNFRTGTDGLHFPNKTTLSATSLNSPAITEVPDHGPQGSDVLAWTDVNQFLNIQIVPDGPKLTLDETSIGAPAFEFVSNPNGTPDTVMLAWTGTDTNHSLNVMLVKTSPLTPGKKTELRQFSSDAGPSLSGSGNGFVLGWSVRGTQRLNLAESTDGANFTSALGSGLPQTSANAPQFESKGGSSGCIAWTGTDAANHLNVQCTTSFPQFPDPAHTKTKLAETALGGPGLTNSEIAWTGTHAAHHLNVAQLQGL